MSRDVLRAPVDRVDHAQPEDPVRGVVPAAIAGERIGEHNGGNVGWPPPSSEEGVDESPVASQCADPAGVEDDRQASRRRGAGRRG